MTNPDAANYLESAIQDLALAEHLRADGREPEKIHAAATMAQAHATLAVAAAIGRLAEAVENLPR